MSPKDLFEILIREHSPRLLAFLRTAVRDAAAVDDLFQDTLLTAWQRLDDFDRTRTFGPWLRGIASHKLLAYYRQLRDSELTLNETSLEWLQNRFDRLQELPGDGWHEKLAALRHCVERLPDHYRTTVQLRYFEEQSLEQTAASLNLALFALKKRLVRAKQKLADCLEHKLEQVRWAQ